jgi:hypothetical protein
MTQSRPFTFHARLIRHAALATLLFAVGALPACAPEDEGPLPGPGPGAGPGPWAPPGPGPGGTGWAGVYRASWASNATFLTPSWPPALYTDTAVITVVDLPGGRIQMSFSGTNNAWATGIFDVHGDTATAVGSIPFTASLNNGAVQTTWCDSCTAQLVRGQLTQNQSGHFEGVLRGIRYAGSYIGAWTGVRQ